MAKILQLRRGTTAQHATFTGAVGEVTVDTDKDTLVVHDGAKAGGYSLQRSDQKIGSAAAADTATQLTNSRSIQVNLASTAAASFNGTANASPGVTGVLPAAYGGTGRTDGKAVAWVTPRTVSLTGAVVGSASVDGSANVSISTTMTASGVPTGAIMAFDLTTPPDGWLLCDGRAVSRTTYAALFAAIGTRHGSGDGSSTFNLPDMDGLFIEGTTDASKVGQKIEAGLPNITGVVRYQPDMGLTGGEGNYSGAFYKGEGVQHAVNGTQYGQSYWLGISASRSNGIYSGSTVQPPAAQALFCIKT